LKDSVSAFVLRLGLKHGTSGLRFPSRCDEKARPRQEAGRFIYDLRLSALV
jgi:hypothetical protein